MNFFVKAKHWQIFLLLFAVPFVFQMVFMFSLFSSITHNGSNGIISGFKLFPVIIVLYIAIYFSWFYSLSTRLYTKLPVGISMNLRLFKICLIFPLIYIFAFSLFIGTMFFNAISPAHSDMSYMPFAFIFIIPVHLFSIFCMFYTLWFNAKTFKSVELQREALIGDYIGEFFLLWYFPIGIWFIQPRINKIFGSVENDNINIPEGYL